MTLKIAQNVVENLDLGRNRNNFSTRQTANEYGKLKNALSYTSADFCMKFHRNHIKTCYFFWYGKLKTKMLTQIWGKQIFGADKSSEQYAQTSISRFIMFVERVHMLPLHRIMSTNFTRANAHIHMINTHFWIANGMACSSRVFVHSFIHSHLMFFFSCRF